MKSTKEMIEIMQHFDNGGEVEFAKHYYDNWELVKYPIWDWKNYDFRVRLKQPELKPLLWEFGYYDDGMLTVNRWFVANNILGSYIKTGRFYNPNTNKFGFEEQK